MAARATGRGEIARIGAIAVTAVVVLTGCGGNHENTPTPAPPSTSGAAAVPGCAAPPCAGPGKVRWRIPLNTSLVVDRGSYFPPSDTGDGPVVSGYGSEKLYVLALDGRVVAIDARSGKTRWALPGSALSRGSTTGQVDVIGGAVDVAMVPLRHGATTTSLLLDSRSGHVVAPIPIPTYGGLAWADDRHAVVVSSDGLRGINLRTKATTWRREVRGVDSRYDVGYADGDIVVAADTGAASGTQAHAIRRIDAITGTERTPLPVPDHDTANRVTTADNTIYIQGARRTYAIDAATGRERWAVSDWPTETVYADPVDATAYLWDGNSKHYRVVGSDGRQATIGQTVQCDLRAGTSLGCVLNANPRQQLVGYSARSGRGLWTSPVVPYFRQPFSLSEPPSMPPPSYTTGIACGHMQSNGANDLVCTEPYLVAVNR